MHNYWSIKSGNHTWHYPLGNGRAYLVSETFNVQMLSGHMSPNVCLSPATLNPSEGESSRRVSHSMGIRMITPARVVKERTLLVDRVWSGAFWCFTASYSVQQSGARLVFDRKRSGSYLSKVCS
ncbi:hypothetical protein VFPPC_15662 [Pochonia chlamydosporia 170]|uniref:Uncharacterized protein n=1 Tax=Pochonia chlamydosporia 170 TaxID=1380566 RepID=A0A179G1P3_METCM|nr:hypothetical protein VFPPC_15662 [Pochonia chlamydosporia 170]OAQ71149.1 hypothetical protein VFPPC_15662 [Pochonia chlamydosporia 170]